MIPTTLLKSPKNWVIYIGDCLLMEKNIHEIRVFFGSNLNFTIRVLTWGLANGLHICKKYEKPAIHIILSNLI